MANVLIIQAQNYSERGDHQSSLLTADALLTKALAIRPWHRLARYDQCLLRRAQARYKDAIAVCRSLVNDLYRRPLVYKEIGLDHVYLGELDQAISAFDAANHLLKYARIRWTWLLGGGWAYLQAGSYGEAIEWLRQVLDVRPQAHLARVWLIAAYALSERPEDAATELAELQRVMPGFFLRDDALARLISNPGSTAFGEHMRIVIEGLRRGGFPERMTKLLLAKATIPVRSSKSAQ